MPDFSKHYFSLLLLGAAALSGCVATEDDVAMTLAMAPTSSVSLPDSVSVLPVPSQAYADAALVLPEDGGEAVSEIAVAAASPATAVTTAKQDRLVAPAPPAAAPTVLESARPPEVEEQVAALSVAEPPKTTLAEAALSLVNLGEPDSPRTEIDRLIEKYAEFYDVPVSLVREWSSARAISGPARPIAAITG